MPAIADEQNHADSDSEDGAVGAVAPVWRRLRADRPGHLRRIPLRRGAPIRSEGVSSVAVRERPEAEPRDAEGGAGIPSSSDAEGDGRCRDTRIRLQGSRVYLEEHLQPGEAGYYFRLTVKCHCCNHRNFNLNHCRKRRNVKVHLGRDDVIAALAFLGTWLEEGPRIVSRGAHIAFRPSSARLRDYIERHNLSEWDVDSIRPRN